jgi:hypothetical protein
MESLQIHENSLSGTLPASLSSCTALGHIQVQNNFLSGEIALRRGIGCEGLHQTCGT